MIKIDSRPVIGRIVNGKFSSTVIITNYEKLPKNFIKFLQTVSFIINTPTHYPDLVCVISSDNLPEMIDSLSEVSSFVRID